MITPQSFYTILITLFYYLILFIFLSFFSHHFPSFPFKKVIHIFFPTYQLIHKVINLSTYHSFFNFSLYFSHFLPIPPHFIFSINFFIFPLDNTPLLCYTLVSRLRNPIKHWHFHLKILNVLLIIKTD